MFFAAVYIFNSLVLKAVFSVINVSVLFIFYLPPVLALGIFPLLAFKITLDLNPIVIELGFVLKAIYYYSFIG